MKKNKILILSYDKNGHSNLRLKEEIEKRGFECVIEKPTDFYCFLSDNKKGFDRVYKRSDSKSEKIVASEYAAIIPRFTDERSWPFSCMVLRHFNENLNIYSSGSVYGLEICVNKFYNAQFMSNNKIPVPKQVLSHRPTDYLELINLVDGLSCIGKLQKGSQGNGVFILNDELAASTALNSMERGGEIVLQQFIDTGEIKNDIRAVCIGAETKNPKIYAYKRFALSKDFRSNYSISGEGEKVELTDEEKEIILNVSKSLHLGVVGVDIMRDSENDNKPYIVETNHAPGLKGVESVTGENVAGEIIEYIIDNHKKGGNRSLMFTPDVSILNEFAKASFGTTQKVFLPHVFDIDSFKTAMSKADHNSTEFKIISNTENGVELEFYNLERLFALGYCFGIHQMEK